MAAGKLLIGAGVALVIIGLILSYAPGLLKWFGRLPGDIRIESNSGYIFIPITSMILISVVFTLLINLFFRK